MARSTRTTPRRRSAKATSAAGVVGAAAAASSSRTSRASPPSPLAIPSRSRGCSTSATRATASCARPGYLAGIEGRLRLGVAGPALRAPQGRLRPRLHAARGEQREVPGAAPRRRDQRHDVRRRTDPSAFRGPHAALPRLEAPPRARRQPARDDRPHRRPHLADREGPARARRLAAEGRQDHDPQAARLLDRTQQPRGPPHGAARRRAARRGHRHAAPRRARRGGREHLRPPVRRAHRGRRAHHRARQAPGRAGHRRRDRPRRHHPARPGVQPVGARVGPHHVGWCRLDRVVPAEEVLRRGPQHRGGRLAHDHRHRARSRPAAGWTT